MPDRGQQSAGNLGEGRQAKPGRPLGTQAADQGSAKLHPAAFPRRANQGEEVFRPIALLKKACLPVADRDRRLGFPFPGRCVPQIDFGEVVPPRAVPEGDPEERIRLIHLFLPRAAGRTHLIPVPEEALRQKLQPCYAAVRQLPLPNGLLGVQAQADDLQCVCSGGRRAEAGQAAYLRQIPPEMGSHYWRACVAERKDPRNAARGGERQVAAQAQWEWPARDESGVEELPEALIHAAAASAQKVKRVDVLGEHGAVGEQVA